MAEHSSDKSGREVELKLRVDDLAALIKIALASGGIPEPTALQVNAFFDTRDRALGTRGLVVRLREERVPGVGATKYFLTSKGPGQRSGNMTDVVEEEIEIDHSKAQGIRQGHDPIVHLENGTAQRQVLVQTIRSTLKGRNLVLIGQFKNERTRIKAKLTAPATSTNATAVSFDCVLELDRVQFPSEQVHHEVEMEVPDGVDHDVATRAFEDLFRRAGVVGRGAPGKARRFFAALRGERID